MEDPQKTSTASKKYEFTEKDVEKLIEAALLNGNKINEGNKGIIFEITLDKCPPEVTDFLLQGTEMPEAVVAKMLKIYSRGAGEKEADFQMKAHRAVAKYDQTKLAKIPQLHIYQELAVKNKALKSHLENAGIRVSEKIEILFMEYVPGEDLATYIYKKIIEHHPGLKYFSDELKENPQAFNFFEIHNIVANTLGFTKPTPQQIEQGLDIKVFSNNASKVLRFLRNRDIIIDKEVIDKIAQTVLVLHRNNIYHNDLHERNVMLVFDEATRKIKDVYFIDFGEADSVEKEHIEGKDRYIEVTYRQLTKTIEERKNEEISKLSNELARIRQNYLKQEQRQKIWQSYENRITQACNQDSENAVKMIDRIIGYCDQPSREEFIAAIIYNLAKEDNKVTKILNEFIVYNNKKKSPYRPQIWYDLKKALSY